MGDLRNKNAQNWATATSLIPIFGGNISQGILQSNLSKQQKEEAGKINPNDPTYQVSEFAKEQLANARNATNARMPGAAQQEGNMFRNQANTMLNLSRAGTAQQQIAGAGAVQGNTNSALANLAAQESQYRTSMLTNLNSSLQNMTNEEGKVYNDNLRKYERDFNMKQGLLNSSQQNFSNSIANASSAMGKGVDIGLKLLTGGSGGGAPKINKTSAATQMFNPSAAGWFQMPSQANYTPSITPYKKP